MKRKNLQHLFSMIPRADVPRSAFDRSHTVKSTFNSGYLVPFFVDEVLPGDTFNLKASIFGRLSTPIVPFMDNLYLETFFFFVPNRLLWDHWENFMGQRENPEDSIDYLVPTVTGTNVQNMTLWDYFGLPTNVAKGLKVSALPFRAYNLIWNEWFRDENLQDSLPFNKGDGPDNLSDYKLVRRGKRHDYFTSALPWPQKGTEEGVQINIGATAPIAFSKTTFTDGYLSVQSTMRTPTSGNNSYNARVKSSLRVGNANAGGDNSFTSQISLNATPKASSNESLPKGSPLTLDITGIAATADLSTATSVTINQLRMAFQIQKLLERDARGGTRYTEILRSHFGVVSPDARLQRPEYLGGSSTRIAIKPVEQTSGTTDVSPQGNLAAYGVVGDTFHGFTKSFVEHGWILGFVNVRADLSYQQGINRMWSRSDRYDFYLPVLSHLGEQTILNKEIYAQGTADDDKVFGYQERWAEMRYKPPMITGKFRSTDPQSLDMWHLAQEFGSLPALNDAFIQDQPPLERVLAVTDEPQILMDSYIKLKCVRPMPVYSVPGLVDHF